MEDLVSITNLCTQIIKSIEKIMQIHEISYKFQKLNGSFIPFWDKLSDEETKNSKEKTVIYSPKVSFFCSFSLFEHTRKNN